MKLLLLILFTLYSFAYEVDVADVELSTSAVQEEYELNNEYEDMNEIEEEEDVSNEVLGDEFFEDDLDSEIDEEMGICQLNIVFAGNMRNLQVEINK